MSDHFIAFSIIVFSITTVRLYAGYYHLKERVERLEQRNWEIRG